MDTKEVPDVMADEPAALPDPTAAEDVEDAPAIVVHPLVVAVRQLEILQNQVFLAGSAASIQAQSRDQGQQPAGEDAGPYCRLACDVLSCAVSACELWRESLLRQSVPNAANPCPELSTAELIRLLSKLLASLHILDCLKDSKQALRSALASVTAQEGDEQQLLAAVQDFFNMPTACLILLRDMLLEDASLLSRTKQALVRLISIQLEAADCGNGSAGHEGERKRGTLKSKLGMSGMSSQTAGDGAGGPADSSIGARSTARISLSLLVYLYCCVDTAEQEHLATIQNPDGTFGVTPNGAKAAAAAAHKLLRACVATLRTTPVVYGYGDVPVDLLRPLQGLPQLAVGAPWESANGISSQQLSVASEERYSLAAVSVSAAHDYGRLVEDVLSLKLQYETGKHRAEEDARVSSVGVEAKPDAPNRAPSHSQAALSRAAGALAGRAMQLLQDWQAAVLQLDAFRTWQRRQRQEDEAVMAELAGGDGEGSDVRPPKPSLSRCAFTSSDLPDVVRMVCYIKGLHGLLVDNMAWLEPLLRLHCAAHLGQLVAAVVAPVAQGVLGAAATGAAAKALATGLVAQQDRQPLPSAARMSIEAHPISAPSSARGTGAGSVFASTGAGGPDAAASADIPIDAATGLAMTLGRMWKAKHAKHGRSHSTASSLEVTTSELRQAPAPAALAAPALGPAAAPPPAAAALPPSVQAEATVNGPSQRTTEDSADTGNLIASITADGLADWTSGRPIDFRTDPYARLRDWFAGGSASAGAAAPLAPPLPAVPEGHSPRGSERSPAAATVASFGRRAIATPSVEVASLAAANSPSVHRGAGGSIGSAAAWHTDGSGARLPATATATDGTEDGVECTVSSVSDCEGLLAELDSEEEELLRAGQGEPQVAITESPAKGKEDAAGDMPEDDGLAGAEEADAAPKPGRPQASPSPARSHRSHSRSQSQAQPQPPQQQQLQPSPSWPAPADLLWPPPPIPSASWLTSHAISPGNTVSAGGATGSAATTRSPGAAMPRMTAPAALSTNPLYIYPSAAREAVAEQERATVAIWVASEGGAPTPGSFAVAMEHGGQGQQSVDGPAAAGDGDRPRLGPGAGMQLSSHPAQRGGYCDDAHSNAATDSVVRQSLQHSLFGDDGRPSGYGEDLNLSGPLVQREAGTMQPVSQQQLQFQMQPGYGNSHAAGYGHGYADEIVVSQSQLELAQQGPNSGLAYGGLRSSFDDSGPQPHVHFDTTSLPPPHPQLHPGSQQQQPSYQGGTKKTASSPFKRIKKLFGKKSSSDKAPMGSGASGAAAAAAAALRAASFEDPAALSGLPEPWLEALYNGEFPGGTATAVGWGALPAPYLLDPREVPGLDSDPNAAALFPAPGGPSYSTYGPASGRNLAGLSGDLLPSLMAEATARDGAVAVLSVGPPVVQGVQADGAQQQLLVQAGGEAGEVLSVPAGKAGREGKPRMMASNGGGGVGANAGGTLKGSGGAAAFLEIAWRARDEYSVQRLRHFANDMQICLATAGIVTGADGTQRTGFPAASQGAGGRVSRKAGSSGTSGARASLKKLVTTIKAAGKVAGRHRAGGDASTAPDQDVHFLPCDAAQLDSGLDPQAVGRLRNMAELMVEELEAMIAQRRARGGKSSKEGPSTMQLLALTSELRTFLHTSLPSVEPLLAFSTNIAAAADLSSLLVLDPSRPYGAAPGNGLGSDARGSVPWELAHKGVLVNTPGPENSSSGGAVLTELPLSAGLTVLTLFKDAIEAIQLQQAQAAATGYPEATTAPRLQLLYRRQAKWCLNTFVQMAARKVWGTYKAHAVRSRLGLPIPQGAPDVASSTAAFQGLFRPQREEQELLLLASSRPDMSLESELSVTDQLAGAIDDLMRHSAARVAELLLGSDLTALVAVKQQLDVLALAVSRLRRELPAIRPWADTWLAALAARAASSPTCSTIAEAAASTAAAVTQGCGCGASGILSAEEIILTHACSVAALRTLSTWSYDMTSVRFKPTKHTKTIWEGLVSNAANPESAPPPLLFPDGADVALTTAAMGAATASAAGAAAASGRAAEGSTTSFSRAHVQALHALLGLDGVARWVTALRRHAVELLADAAALLRRVHELYDSSLAGPRGPGMRDAGGASGYLQLQQRWLRDRGHSELLVSAHRAMQALGNTVAAVALTDSVLAELCVGRAPHLLPLAASSLQADQQAHSALKAAALAGPPSNAGTGLVKASAPAAVPPPPRGAGLAGLLLGQQLPPGLMNGTQSAVQAASLVQDRLQEQLPPAFGLPGLWRALHECLLPGHVGIGSGNARPALLFSPVRLWCVVQVQLSCLSPEEQVVHSTNVGDGVYVSAAALVQLAGGAPVAPGSVLNGDTMTLLQQAVSLEQLKAGLAAVSVPQNTQQGPSAAAAMESGTMEQLKAWASRAEVVRAAWDRAVQLTVGAGTSAAKISSVPRSARTEVVPTRGLDLPALTSCSSEPWAALAQQAAAAGTAMIIRAASAAAAPAPQVAAAQGQAVAQSQGGVMPGSRLHSALTQGRPSSQPGVTLNQTMPNPSRPGPPRPTGNSGSQQPSLVSANGVTGVQRVSINGPPLPPRMSGPVPGQAYGRGMVGGSMEGPLVQQQHQQQQQQQALQTLRAASQVLLRSPRGEGATLGPNGLFTMAGSTAAQSRSRAASSLGDWGHME